MNDQRKLVQFFGGPLDGHEQDVSKREEPLPTLLQLEIGAKTFRLLARKMPTSDVSTTSVAVYELNLLKGNASYRFVTAQKPAKRRTADR
jgi:hypothetical protein